MLLINGHDLSGWALSDGDGSSAYVTDAVITTVRDYWQLGIVGLAMLEKRCSSLIGRRHRAHDVSCACVVVVQIARWFHSSQEPDASRSQRRLSDASSHGHWQVSSVFSQSASASVNRPTLNSSCVILSVLGVLVIFSVSLHPDQ